MFSSYVHRTRIIENCLSKSRNTQAAWKSISSPKECISSMKAHRSSLDKHATCAVRDMDVAGVSETTDLSSSSIWTVQVVQAHVFLLGQLQMRCPCFLHSKHRPVLWYSLRSLSFVALQITVDVSMALSSWGGRCGQGGAWFPGLCQFWLLDPGLLPPGRLLRSKGLKVRHAHNSGWWDLRCEYWGFLVSPKGLAPFMIALNRALEVKYGHSQMYCYAAKREELQRGLWSD